jgi:ribosomal protein S18 acetylase RimI-like enzyme
VSELRLHRATNKKTKTSKKIVIRESREDEIRDVVRLIKECFDRFIAPLYPEEGVHEFHSYIEPEAIAQRLRENHTLLIALESTKGRIVGALLLRAPSHISMFFVSSEFQGRGIGKQLFHLASEICRKTDPSLANISVNASPNSVEFYERLGFVAHGEEQIINGIRFLPMEFKMA